MVLQVSSNASYLSEPEAHSRTGGHFYLCNNDGRQQQINGPILFLSSIIKHVVSSAVKAKVGSIFNNAMEVAPMRVMLEEMGHHQPPHSNSNRQFNSIWNIEQQGQSKEIQGNGHEIILVQDRIESNKNNT
jgi:hypothetical protein